MEAQSWEKLDFLKKTKPKSFSILFSNPKIMAFALD